MKISVAIGTLAAVAALIGLGATFPGGTLPKVHAQEVDLEGCSAATLTGRYGLTFSGFSTNGAVPAPINAFIPVAGGGIVTFDGNGNFFRLGDRESWWPNLVVESSGHLHRKF